MQNIKLIAAGLYVGLAAIGMTAGSAHATVLIDFEPEGYVVGASVNALKPDGTLQVPPVTGTNPDAQAWSVRDGSMS